MPKNISDPSITRVSTTPASLRMLSISNTDHKLIAAALAQPLGQLAENTVVGQQRGGIVGRVMGDAIIDIETHALLCTRMAATWPGIV